MTQFSNVFVLFKWFVFFLIPKDICSSKVCFARASQWLNVPESTWASERPPSAIVGVCWKLFLTTELPESTFLSTSRIARYPAIAMSCFPIQQFLVNRTLQLQGAVQFYRDRKWKEVKKDISENSCLLCCLLRTLSELGIYCTVMGVSAACFEKQSETSGEEQSRKPVNSDGVNFTSVDSSLFHTGQGSAKSLSQQLWDSLPCRLHVLSKHAVALLSHFYHWDSSVPFAACKHWKPSLEISFSLFLN